MFELILGSLWFFLPAGVANSMPPLASKFFGKGTPVNERWFGSHKTWQGLITGTLGGWIFFIVQRSFFPTLSIVDYTSLSPFLGFSFGFGAIAGDMVKSFFKRKVGIKPGKPWIPFDQIDYVIGAMVCVAPFVRLPLQVWVIILVCYFVFVLIVNRISFAVGTRETPL